MKFGVTICAQNWDWFTTYKVVNYNIVLIVNNMPCKIIGIGIVRIKMHDGIVKTLTNVRHVPKLKKNLIYLCALNSNRCKCTIEGGVMRVTKCTLMVMRG